MNPKPALHSRTIVGALVMLISFLLQAFGLEGIVSTDELGATLAKAFEAINTSIFVVGFVVTIIGRIRARRSIRGIVSPQRGSRHGAALIVAAPLLCLALLSTGCDRRQVTRIIRAGETIETVATINRAMPQQLLTANFVDADGARRLDTALGNLERTAAEFTRRARSFREFSGSLNASAPEAQKRRQELAALAGEMLVAFDTLLADGTLHVKNPQARARVSLLLTALRIPLRTIQHTLADGDGSARN